MKAEHAISKHEFLAVLRSRVDTIGQQRRAAQLFGVSGAYLSDVLHEKREPSRRLLEALGYERVVLYQRARRRPA